MTLLSVNPTIEKHLEEDNYLTHFPNEFPYESFVLYNNEYTLS